MYRYRRKTSLCHLPKELLEYIFCRLPIKSIVNLISVCKIWYEIVMNPSFISMHADWCAKNHSGYLLHHHECHNISRLDKGFNFLQQLEFPIHDSLLVGSCNGLLCMRHTLNKDLKLFPYTYIWNPSIRALKKLPDTIHHFEDDHDGIEHTFYASAFGFDRQANDYKVFHMVLVKLRKQQAYVIKNHLYSLKTNSWKVIQADHHPSSFPSRYHCCHTCFNGAFYWIPLRQNRTSPRFIMWFDFCDETFSKTKLPVYDDNKIILSIGSLKNSLVLYISDARKGRKLGNKSCTIDTWVMKKLSNGELIWERQLSVVIPLQLAWPLTTGLNGEILVFKYYCLNNLQFCFRFGVYDFKKENIREVDTNVDKHIRVRGLFTYSESLSLLGKMDTY